MNQMLTTMGAMAAVAKVASTAYYYAEQFGVFNKEAKVEAETRSLEMAENQSADVGIPVFNGSGYEIWSSMMKTLFVSQDLWDMVDGGYVEEELTVEVLREVRKKDAMALLFIQQAIDNSVFSCIAGASKSKEAWDALQNKYQGDAEESNRQNSVDESSVLSCPADATECREAWDALEMESRGYYTDEPNQKKAVDELVLSYAADAIDPKEAAWDASEQGCKANTKVVEAKRIGKESGDIKNNNCGSKKGSRGISNHGGRGGRNCGRFNNNQGGDGGRDCECSNNQGSHGGTGNGDFNNSQGGRGGQGRGHINNHRGGRGGKGRGHIDNKRGGNRGKDHGRSNNNQGDCRGTGSGGCGGQDDGWFNSNKGHSGGIDNGHFNKGSEAAVDYNSKNAKSESASTFTTNATETKEALDAHARQQGLQANTEVHAQSQVRNPNGGESQSLTTLLVGDFDVSVTDLQLLGIFIRFGQVVSSGVFRDMGTHCSLGYGYVTYGNPQDADRALKELNFTPLNGKPIQIMYFQQDSTEHKSGGFNTKKINYGGIDGAHFNNNQGGRVGTDGGCFNNKDSKLRGYNSMNPNFESVSSCSTNATESREASDAPQQGHQANTEVKAQPQVGNPSGGSILIKKLDKAIDERALHAIFSAFGNILSCKVETNASGQSKGYGHIEYDSEEAAQEAIEKVNGMLLNHKKVYVGPFVSKQERAKAMEMTKSTKVYVGNLSESTTKEDLREIFGHFGTIASVVVVRDEDAKSKCFGFVNFKDADDASWCIQVLNGHKFDNKEWCVRRRASQKKRVRGDKKKSVDESVPSSTANASESKKAGDAVSEKEFIGKPQKKSVDESVSSSTVNETESKKAVEAVQKGYRANTRVLYIDDMGVGHFKLKKPKSP